MVLLLYGPPYFDGHNSNPLTFPIAARFNYPNRRFNFRVHRYANCSYTEDELESNNGWNKIGRISFIRNSNANIFKMHLGWIFRDDPNTIEFSLFYHNNEHKSSGYIAHKIDERHFQPRGAIGDANMIRIMGSTEYAPNGYAVFHNSLGQPYNPNNGMTLSKYNWHFKFN